MIPKRESLDYHAMDRPGKIEVRATKPCLTPRELRLAYIPGVSFPALEIIADPSAVFRYTSRGNLIGVLTNGSAVPGLGNVGPGPAKPMQEGVAILYKQLADIDVFDLELNTSDPDAFVEAARMLEPTFGGIVLKDIQAPDGLYIHDRLCGTLNIPVFHENLYSTAVVAVAALTNALELVDKRVDAVRVVLCGAGTVGIGCARMLRALGVPRDNLLVYDIHGLLHPGREDLSDYQREFARDDPARRLEAGMKGADVFVGVSTGGIVSVESVRSMNRFPIVFALATPEPEIEYEQARASRQDAIVATGLGQYPNTILDVLSFPYILRGALDVHATAVTESMLLAAARSLADLAREEVVEEVERAYGSEHFVFGPEYLLPKPIDPRILAREAAAVARQAIEDGVAASPVDIADYQDRLVTRIGTGRETMRHLIMRARQTPTRVVFSEGTSPTILRASSILIDEGIASPILLGDEEEIHRRVDELGLDLRGVSIVDPARSPRLPDYAEEYFRMRRRDGVMRPSALERLRQGDYFAAMMLHAGDADMMIAGSTTHYIQSLRTIIEVIGPAPDTRRISSHYLVLLPRDVVVLADCAVNVDPTAEEMAEIALLAARKSRSLGIEPRVAMLSFSNFGSTEHPHARKVREATAIARARAPELSIDGEMQLSMARDSAMRERFFPFADLQGAANVLVFPDVESGNMTMHSLQYMGDAVPIGPVLMGTRLPAHLLQYGATAEEVVNLTTVGVVEAQLGLG